MDDELINIKEVNKTFGKNSVLDSINLTIPENKITGIIGASGEGKTTIMKLIVGFYKPTSGEILYSKRNIYNDMKNVKNIFGFATEDGSFHTRLSVIENMYHFGRLHHVKEDVLKERSNKLLKLVELENAKHTPAGDLSMGMKKRLDIAISLIHKPKILIMDEPTADLDPLLRKQMLKLIKKINDLDTTIILTTQILGEMDRICDKIAVLFRRKIIEEGEPGKIKSKYSSSNLNEVFNKIFSKREEEKKRKSEQTNNKKEESKKKNKMKDKINEIFSKKNKKFGKENKSDKEKEGENERSA